MVNKDFREVIKKCTLCNADLVETYKCTTCSNIFCSSNLEAKSHDKLNTTIIKLKHRYREIFG